MIDAPLQSPFHEILNAIQSNQSIHKPGLYVVATPLGNLADMSLRGLAVLGCVDYLLCEDTRVTRKLLNAYGLKPRLVSYHQHNEAAMVPQVAADIEEGACVGLVSDAGMPGISDPGQRLIAALHEKALPLTVLPGACAAVTGLVASGLCTKGFQFLGFPPTKEKETKDYYTNLKGSTDPLVFYEAPHRVLKTIRRMHQFLGERRIVVCRELTKRFETMRRGYLSEVVAWLEANAPLKGELVLVVEGAPQPQSNDHFALEDFLEKAMGRLSLKEAVSLVCDVTGSRRQEVYALALQKKATQ